MRDDTNEMEMLGITADGKLIHQGKLLGPTAISKLLSDSPEQIVHPSVAVPGDILGIATGEDYQKVRDVIAARDAKRKRRKQ